MTRPLTMTPWARRLVYADYRMDLVRRIPNGYNLDLSSPEGRTLNVYLRDERHRIVAEAHGPFPTAVEACMAAIDVADWRLLPDMTVSVPLTNRGERDAAG